jgi:hypothetical protein
MNRRGPPRPRGAPHRTTRNGEPLKLRQYVTAAALTAAAIVSPAMAAAQAATPGPAYFASHEIGDGSTVRLWDAWVTWADLEPERGVWQWGTLDALVADARSRGVKVNLVLGMTPQWASVNPGAASPYFPPGRSAPPADQADWSAYVSAVVTRYAGRIAAYEVWNEADLPGFYSGSVEQLAAMTVETARVVRSVDPGALVLSPSTVPIRGNNWDWMRRFALAGGYDSVDVVSVHGYPMDGTAPESAVKALGHVRAKLRALGVTQPWWNTETNYGMYGVSLPAEVQAQYVARTAWLSWASGFRQVAWYEWRGADSMGVYLSRGGQSTAAGRVLAVTRHWMAGDVTGCRSRGDVYRCAVDYPSGRRGIVKWSTGSDRVRVPHGTVAAEGMYGQDRDVDGKRRVRVGGAPVRFLVR